MGYKEKDIANLSNYSKEITKDNLNKSKIIEQKQEQIGMDAVQILTTLRSSILM